MSYRSFEREFAARLARDLRNSGIGVWMDALDAGIEGGDDWPRRLEDAIDNCAGMICILSPDYVESKYCLRELHRADQRDVPIVPLVLQSLRGRKSPIEFERTQYIDFERWQEERFYERQYQRLTTTLRRKLSPIFGSPPDHEAKYLNDLMAELSAAMGVLEYTELSTVVVDSGQRPPPWPEDEWGYSLLGVGHRRSVEEKGEYTSVTEVLNEHPRFILVGAPGAGKSTMLRRLARETALARRENPRANSLPLLLDLAQWPSATTLNEFVQSRWPFDSDVKNAIRSGDVIIFLDGLNEMGDAGPSNAAHLRKWLKSDDGPKAVVTTCRANEYKGDLHLGEIPTILVKELQPEQITVFVRRYLQDRAPAFLRQLGIQQDGRITRDTGLPVLAQNPYFLRSLIELFVLSGVNHLPQNSGMLMDRLTKALWRREEQRKTRGLVPLRLLRSRCALLARAILEEGKPLQVPIDYAQRNVTRWFEFAWRRRAAAKLFHSAGSAGLLSLDRGAVRFKHQLVNEYFTALSFLHRSEQTQAKQVQEQLRRYRPNLKETLIAYSGLVKTPDNLVRLFFSKDPLLAGRCLASGVVVSDGLRTEIVEALIALIKGRPLSSIVGHSEADAAEALGLIGDVGSEGITALGELLMEDSTLPFESAASALSRLGTKAAAVELRRAVDKRRLEDDDFLSRASDRYVIDRLADIGAVAVPELIDTLEQAHAKYDELRDVPRSSSVDALVRVGQAAVPALLQALKTGTGAASAGSAQVLGQLGSVEAIPHLLDAYLRAKVGCYELKSSVERAFKALGDCSIPHLAAELTSPKPERRAAAATVMGAIGTSATNFYLLKALQDVSYEVRSAAGFSLARRGVTVVDLLIEFLDGAPPHGAAEAAGVLGYLKDARAVPQLTALLKSSDGINRSKAAFALGQIGDGQVVSALISLLQDQNAHVAEAAAKSLGELGNESAVDPLIRSLTERKERDFRQRAALSLERIGTESACDSAKQYWREALSQNYHKWEAGDALGRMRDSSSVPLLVQAMQDGPEFARSHYIKALGLIGHISAVPAIIEHLHDVNRVSSHPMDIRASAIEALGRMKDPRAVVPLTELLSDTTGLKFGHERICDLAASALEKISTGESLHRAGEYWRISLRLQSVRTRLLAAEALGQLRYEPATEELIRALADQEETGFYDKRTVSDLAASALEALGTPAALSALKAYWTSELTSSRPRGRALGIIGLGRLESRESEPQLIELLTDSYGYEDRYVADYAAEVLEQFSSREARLALARYYEWREKRT